MPDPIKKFRCAGVFADWLRDKEEMPAPMKLFAARSGVILR